MTPARAPAPPRAPRHLAPAWQEVMGLHQRGDTAAACAACHALLKVQPHHVSALSLAALYAAQGGDGRAALVWLNRALALQPHNAKLHLNAAQLHTLAGDVPAARHAAQCAANHAPADSADHHAALLALADAHLALGKPAQAVAHYQRLIDALACTAELRCSALHNAAVAHERLAQPEQALTLLRQLESLAQDRPFLAGWIAHAQCRLADWRGLDERVRHIDAQLRRGLAAVQPFQWLALGDNAATALRCAQLYQRHWQTRWQPDGVPPAVPMPRAADGRITLAYVSADFNAHATSHLMAEMLELHDRQRFRVVGYSLLADTGDAMARRVKAAFDDFFQAHDWPDARVAAHMREQGVHIAVDLKGHTQHARTGVFMQRPAPVVVNYLGFPGSMGSPVHDYIVADAVVVPQGAHAHYSEHVVRLPGSYQCNDRQRPLPQGCFTRASEGLADDAVVLCCFNSTYKITPAVFDVWMAVLQAVPQAVLWLLHDHRAVTHNLRAEAQKRGVNPARLHFAPRAPVADYISRLALADLFLDTWPCNPHTTASDALWAGLPVLTCAGQTFASRVAASLLHAVGLGEMVTESVAAYQRQAIALARDAAKRAALRQHLLNNRLQWPLFDTPTYARHLEAAFEQMVLVAQTGRKLASFDITP